MDDLTKLVERIPHEQNYCGSMNYSCQPDCLRCAFDAALAARPVRAVLTEDEVREAWREWWNKQPGVEERTMFQRIQQAFYAGAALERQHAEPPATISESINSYSANWPVANEEAFERICDLCGKGYKGTQHTCAEPPDAAVEEAKRRMFSTVKRHSLRVTVRAEDVRLVCGAKP